MGHFLFQKVKYYGGESRLHRLSSLRSRSTYVHTQGQICAPINGSKQAGRAYLYTDVRIYGSQFNEVGCHEGEGEVSRSSILEQNVFLKLLYLYSVINIALLSQPASQPASHQPHESQTFSFTSKPAVRVSSSSYYSPRAGQIALNHQTHPSPNIISSPLYQMRSGGNGAYNFTGFSAINLITVGTI